MKLGSVEHKELFCRSFMESYREYEPEYLSCPDLDDTALSFLCSIPFWEKALDAERQAGAIVSGYAATVSDPLLQTAIALQGKEELCHARLLQTLINRYCIEIPECFPVQVPQNIQPVFTRFRFEIVERASTARRKSKGKSQKSKVLWNKLFRAFQWSAYLRARCTSA